MCCSHAIPAITNSPFSAAVSSSHRGGTVYVRTAFSPLFAMSAKSRATTDGGGYGSPSRFGRKVP